MARGYATPRAFYVDKVVEGVATIAAAFIRNRSSFVCPTLNPMSTKLIGGSRYEPDEENPMLGFRGAAAISKGFQKAFAMECEAIKRVRDEMGLTNVEIMVPFVRTVNRKPKP